MFKILTAIGLVLLLGGLACHFASLSIFNALIPKDAGGQRVAAGLSYGPHKRQRLDLYRPDGPGPFPVLFFSYGGSWDSGWRQDYGFVGRAFAAQGYLTAIADYRLVPEVHYPAFVDDTKAAMDWVVSHAAEYGGDGRGLFVAGHSAGAYNAAQAVLQRHKNDIRAAAFMAVPADFLPFDSAKSIAAFSTAPDLPETQPINQDLRNAPPMLLLHGTDDETVGLHNSRNFFAALAAAGRAPELKIYDGLGHVGILLALAKPLRGRAPVLDDILRFFQRYR